MRNRILSITLAAVVGLGVLTLTPTGAQAALPTGSMVAPITGSSYGPGETITIRVNAQDTPGTTGPTARVVQTEAWLYAEASQGAPTDFRQQRPNNVEAKVFIGSGSLVAGTAANGTWQFTWTVPTAGYYDAPRDGDHTDEVPAGQTRRYTMPSGAYQIQVHMLDDEWLANPGVPGYTQKITVNLNTGTAASPSPSPSPTTATPTPTPAPTTSSPAPAPTSATPTPTATVAPANLVKNPSLDAVTNGLPTCFERYGWGTSTATWTATGGTMSLQLSGYGSGDRKLMPTQSTACAIPVTAGQRYDLSMRYSSTSPNNGFTVFYRNNGVWGYWTNLSYPGAAASLTTVRGTTPVIPAGVDYITFGMSIAGNGTLVTDDYSAVVQGGATPTPTPTVSVTPTPTPTVTPTSTPTTPPTTGNLVKNADLTTAAGANPACFSRVGWGTSTPTWTYANGEMTLALAGRTSGDWKLMPSQTVDCAIAVTPGQRYDLSVAYKSTVNNNGLTVFYRQNGTWNYWVDLSSPAASTQWVVATGRTPAVPTGVDYISFGMSLSANGTMVTDNYAAALVGATPTPTPTPSPTATAPGGWTGKAAVGEWQTLNYTLPGRAIHSTLLDNGNVLLVAGSGNDPNLFAAGSFRAWVWNVNTGAFLEIPVPEDMFCAGHVTLPDGQVLLAGGTKSYPGQTQGVTEFAGAVFSYIFDPTTNKFTKTNDLNSGHWYPTLTKLADGDVWAVGGLGEDTKGNVYIEYFDFETKRWRTRDQVPQAYRYWGTYPSVHLLEDGRLFYTGTHTFGGGLTQDDPGGAWIYNWTNTQSQNINGLRDVDLRDQSASVLLPPAQDQRFMIVGGGNTDTNLYATNKTDLINLKGGSGSYAAGPDMPGPGKIYPNATILPDRNVLVSGGGRLNRADPVYTAAVFSPVTNTWTEVPGDPVGRLYHGASFTMPDGRVVEIGGNPLDNSFELRISVYSPGYMFRNARPAISGTPATVRAGGTLTFDATIPSGRTLKSVGLLHPGSPTHQIDPNLRLVDTPVISQSNGKITVQVPANRNIIPPGPYMLSIVDSENVPSVAQWVRVS